MALHLMAALQALQRESEFLTKAQVNDLLPLKDYGLRFCCASSKIVIRTTCWLCVLRCLCS